MMTTPAVSPLIPLYLAELIFGILYAMLIHWVSIHGWLKGNTAWSVVVGDGATLFVEWLFVRECWEPGVTFACFACSGFPMLVSYLYRYQTRVEKTKHTKSPWPTAARQMRDEAVIDIAMTIKDIQDAANTNQINAGFLLQVSNKLHGIKKTLTSV